MTPPSTLAPGVALDQDLSLSRKRKRRAEPTESSRKKSCSSVLKSGYISTTRRHASGFWDLLQRVYLTHQALEEFDRRDALSPTPAPPRSRPKRGKRCEQQLTSKVSTHLRRFARTGGPDLTDIRGYYRRPSIAMAPKRKSAVHPPANPKDGKGTLNFVKGNLGIASSSSTSSNTTSPYTLNFEKKLLENGITQHDPTNAPANVGNWKERMEHKLPKKLLSNLEARFLEFQKTSAAADKEPQVMSFVYPFFRESARKDQLHGAQQNGPCKNWEPLIPPPSEADEDKSTLVTPQPDLWDGIPPHKYKKLRKKIPQWIIPARTRSPSLPNFFGEFKSPSGTAGRAQRQACYDGALGARGMHKVQNIGREEGKEKYDKNAYTISFTYGSGSLTAYLHFLTPPKFPGDDIPYNMIMIGGWHLSGSLQGFLAGITAFRNARDMAAELRVQFANRAMRRLEKNSRLSDQLGLGSPASSFHQSQNGEDEEKSSDEENGSDDNQLIDSSDEADISDVPEGDDSDIGDGEQGGEDDEDEDEEGTETEGEDTETEHAAERTKSAGQRGGPLQSFDGASSTDSNYSEGSVQPPRKRQRGSPIRSALTPKSKSHSKSKAVEPQSKPQSKPSKKGKARAEDELDPKMAMLAKGYGSSQ